MYKKGKLLTTAPKKDVALKEKSLLTYFIGIILHILSKSWLEFDFWNATITIS